MPVSSNSFWTNVRSYTDGLPRSAVFSVVGSLVPLLVSQEWDAGLASAGCLVMVSIVNTMVNDHKKKNPGSHQRDNESVVAPYLGRTMSAYFFSSFITSVTAIAEDHEKASLMVAGCFIGAPIAFAANTGTNFWQRRSNAAELQPLARAEGGGAPRV